MDIKVNTTVVTRTNAISNDVSFRLIQIRSKGSTLDAHNQLKDQMINCL